MHSLVRYIEILHDFFWGVPMFFVFLGTGLILQIALRFMPIRWIVKGLHAIWRSWVNTGQDKSNMPGEISSYAALMTGLASTVGTGNIIGVASAIAIGGPGSVFWMWCTALAGIATKYAEVLLSVHFRQEKNGHYFGGPMYVVRYGMGPRWKWLAQSFALFTIVASMGTGAMTQTNSIADALYHTLNVPNWITGLIVSLIFACVVLGGIKRIGLVAQHLVPWMCFTYVAMGLAILAINYRAIPHSFALIFSHAFSPTAAIGGFSGATIMKSIQYGIARGVFCNEAGTGTAAIAQSAGKTNDPVHSGMIGMMGVFIDTMVICTITALVVIITNTWTSGNIGSQLYSQAVSSSLGHFGVYCLDAEIVVFAFTTVLAWSYYAERAWVFLVGEKAQVISHILIIIMAFVGSITQIKLVWLISDLANALMALPNIAAIIYFLPLIRELTTSHQEKEAFAC